jgi:hypothetical protein
MFRCGEYLGQPQNYNFVYVLRSSEEVACEGLSLLLFRSPIIAPSKYSRLSDFRLASSSASQLLARIFDKADLRAKTRTPATLSDIDQFEMANKA